MSEYPKFYLLASKIPILVQIKKRLDSLEELLFFIKRFWKINVRNVIQAEHTAPEYKVCIVCVKRPEYMDAAIKNINSLHYHNQQYRCEIYCDTICFRRFVEIQRTLDYPSNVQVFNAYNKTQEPWQYYKLQTLKKISKENGVLVDADSRWFGEPKIERDKVMFLCFVYDISNQKNEHKLLSSFLSVKKIQGKKHFATGFLSIPIKFATEKMWNTVDDVYKNIIKNTQDQELLRLKDELAINVGIQLHVPTSSIEVLKDSDGPWDRNILQSYYYGTTNRISE